MKIIIGLGNIGREYENTRHNAGFMAIDKLAQMLEMDFNQEKFSAYFAKKKIDGEDIILLKPTTYMNNSGIALRQCMDFYKVSSEDILVLYDDIISHIGTQEFDRIRIGIGKDKLIPVVDWVLGKFPQEQQEDLNHALEQAAKAAKFSIKHSFSDTMNRYNKK